MRAFTQCLVIMAIVVFGSRIAFAQNLDRPMRDAWPVTRSWDADAEADYGVFVHAIGRAIARGRCHTLRTCLNAPGIDPLAEPVRSAPLLFRADCADVPYLLRAWFAYRRGLPFAHAARMLGAGEDPRYLTSAYPEGRVAWTDYPTPRALFESMGHIVHSGFLRTSPKLETGDFYHAAVEPGSVRPGTVFYNPNGHVLVVYDVRGDGSMLVFDGHVGGRLTHGPLDARVSTGPAANGGGFKNFRPIVVRNGRVVALPDAALADFGAAAQYTETGGARPDFVRWARAQLRRVARRDGRAARRPLRADGVRARSGPGHSLGGLTNS